MTSEGGSRAASAYVDMSNSAQWTVTLTVEALAAIESEIGQFLSREGVEGHAAYVSQLVIEEIVRNLIEHTPPYAQNETATVTITIDSRIVTVVIEDRRPSFNPFDAPPLDTHAPLEERRAGGVGLHLVVSMTDRLIYDAGDDSNRLTAVISRR